MVPLIKQAVRIVWRGVRAVLATLVAIVSILMVLNAALDDGSTPDYRVRKLERFATKISGTGANKCHDTSFDSRFAALIKRPVCDDIEDEADE